MRGDYRLTQEEREKYIPYIQECIAKLEPDGDVIKLNDTTLNPYNVCDILEELGYHKEDNDSNGWDWDFWFYYRKLDESEQIVVSGTGITFDLKISKRLVGE